VPLGAAVHRGVFTIAGHATIPPFADRIPLMRNPAAPRAWDARVWYLWDGVSEWRVGARRSSNSDSVPKGNLERHHVDRTPRGRLATRSRDAPYGEDGAG
jgi:hypothetical protein